MTPPLSIANWAIIVWMIINGLPRCLQPEAGIRSIIEGGPRTGGLCLQAIARRSQRGAGAGRGVCQPEAGCTV